MAADAAGGTELRRRARTIYSDVLAVSFSPVCLRARPTTVIPAN